MFVQRKDAERAEARRLRAEGMSVKRIAATVGVSVSSVSVWVRDIEKPPPAPQEPPPAPVPADDGRRRYCSYCDRDLPLAAFNRNGDGHQHWCRECFTDYFRERGQRHRDQSRAASDRRRELGREVVLERLRAEPCADCGEDEILVLELDHCRGRKTANVAAMLADAAALSRIRRELECCEVVCVNCHRRRTATRAGYFRATGIPPRSWTASQRRNNTRLVEVLQQSGCVDCGERDPIVLDFDHRKDKRAMVTRLAMGCSLQTLEAEIAKCDIRCANCHRLRTLNDAGCWREGDHWAAALHHIE